MQYISSNETCIQEVTDKTKYHFNQQDIQPHSAIGVGISGAGFETTLGIHNSITANFFEINPKTIQIWQERIVPSVLNTPHRSEFISEITQRHFLVNPQGRLLPDIDYQITHRTGLFTTDRPLLTITAQLRSTLGVLNTQPTYWSNDESYTTLRNALSEKRVSVTKNDIWDIPKMHPDIIYASNIFDDSYRREANQTYQTLATQIGLNPNGVFTCVPRNNLPFLNAFNAHSVINNNTLNQLANP